MVPVIELRGAIPVGVAMGLPLLQVLLACIIGNMLPIPIIIIFVRRVFAWMRKISPKLDKMVAWFEERANRKSGVIEKYQYLGLFIFVAIPLPGTGAWTGALIAALMNMRTRSALVAIFLGVIGAGLIMTVLSYGVSALF